MDHGVSATNAGVDRLPSELPVARARSREWWSGKGARQMLLRSSPILGSPVYLKGMKRDSRLSK